ncbi:MAG TPA: UV DNA damage repair endonuclease UvsE [Syntrophomonadaceae bacterium]|nr:UV DNA damage repair endonuclease UvsE [Syntrophomonadaceae bacterium]HOQ09449.1 UV DNA damage repair endonuclease UvsE [Syntrophomonadaceae bacterium]HPU48281.1 UV DNA damage repair endonuclease UvsE [Syntrophomonadaceae bacterium]
MKIRLGYVAMSSVLQNCSPSKTITAGNLSKIEPKEARHSRLLRLARENLHNTQRLFFHNKAHDIKVFRLTSKLIPLATHPLAEDWNWYEQLQEQLASLGEYARQNGFRLSAHPDHYTLLNSPREEVVSASLRDLEYHHKIFQAMQMDASAKLVIHVGGSYKNKKESLQRFKENFALIPAEIRSRIILENDDKIFTVAEVLELCHQIHIPMVLDIHHHWCNNQGDDIRDYFGDILATWKEESFPPKVHVSSPRSSRNIRAHADYVDVEFFMSFVDKIRGYNTDIDVMIEAKKKDGALFQLMDDLKKVPSIKILDEATILAE